MYLLDTNVMSATAPARAMAPRALTDWLRARTDTLYFSVVSVSEIAAGIAKAQRRGAALKAQQLTVWLEGLLGLYCDRALPFDVAAAQVAGRLLDRAQARGQAPGFADIAIGATATCHGLVVLTRNLRHFQPLGIASIDPFQGLPVD